MALQVAKRWHMKQNSSGKFSRRYIIISDTVLENWRQGNSAFFDNGYRCALPLGYVVQRPKGPTSPRPGVIYHEYEVSCIKDGSRSLMAGYAHENEVNILYSGFHGWTSWKEVGRALRKIFCPDGGRMVRGKLHQNIRREPD
ncbi:MAG: hypothetical protein HYW26_04825 [Candidatus Aenigmarchaeota archaeon]|nr:hypothetical protein [Candidatus Aenigmarchaeota archaeon]